MPQCAVLSFFRLQGHHARCGLGVTMPMVHWYPACGHDKQPDSTSSSSWMFFSNTSHVSSSTLQIVGLYYFPHSHSRHPAQQTFLCTTLSLNNADGFSQVTKEPELETGKGVLSIPLPSLELCQGLQKKAEDPHWWFQLRRAYWGWRKEDWVLEDHVKIYAKCVSLCKVIQILEQRP